MERMSRKWKRHTSSHVLRITRSHVSLLMRGVHDTLKQLHMSPPLHPSGGLCYARTETKMGTLLRWLTDWMLDQTIRKKRRK